MKIKKEVKVGFLMLLSIALVIWGANFLKGTNILKEGRTFYAVYDQIDGLSKSNPILINGFKVGQVEDIRFLPDYSGRLLVKFSLSNKDFMIPEDSKARIVSSDLLGSKSIDLQLGTSSVQIENNDTLVSDIEASLTEAVNQQIAPLKKKAEDLLQTVDSAILVVSTIFNKKARTDLDASFTSIRTSLEAFERTMGTVDQLVAEEREHLKGIFTNIESITRNMAQNNARLTSVLENIDVITDSLAGANLRQTVANASFAMEEVAELMEKVNSGQGSLGALINNDTLYTNLEAAAGDLDKLLLDMRLNPERYVHFSIFGRKKKDAKQQQPE
jgi:phospholipid/cholesterol/gamma-HCH transport system substrate-binding protein